MFIEPSFNGAQRGWIEVICGAMFSGKTEELIRRLRRAEIANLRIEIYKPAKDNRYHHTNVVSHNANTIASTAIENSQTILLYTANADVIGIDEAQFFDPEIISVCETLALRGTRVIAAGLDMDYKAQPFGPMPSLLAIADYITKLHAICVKCGSMASYSYRKTAQQNRLVIGEADIYEPRCRKCYYEAL